MNYPLISDYVSSILSAEDNFKELTNLRPVLDEEGKPIMRKGNNSVVFKMTDTKSKKFYAIKCFLNELEGREKNYQLISEELEDISSNYMIAVHYKVDELLVKSLNTNQTEYPILLMDWVEGTTLIEHIYKNINFSYELNMLTYRFSKLAFWLLSQPLAHGDLNISNVIVKKDGSLVLVDYDTMFVPAMKGNKSLNLGNPNFCHPLKTKNDFNEHIDDFAIASILLSLKAISLKPDIINLYKSNNLDGLLFSQEDYLNLSNCSVIEALRPLMFDTELNLLLSLFLLAHSNQDLSMVSHQILKIKKPTHDDVYQNGCFSYSLCHYDDAIKWWKIAAEKGNANAQYCLGECYRDGIAVNPNDSIAAKWWKKAAKNGHDLALLELGYCYYEGNGVELDYMKAIDCWIEAAEKGNVRAQFLIAEEFYHGNIIKKNLTKAVYWYKAAAEQGSIYAQYAIGYCYENGEGIETNHEKAITWYKKSAEKGHIDSLKVLAEKYGDSDAQYTLGMCYYNGTNIEKNLNKALFLIQESAEQGNSDAQFALGIHLYNDEDKKKELSTAIKWINKASVSGNADAQYFLGNYYSGDASLDLEEAVTWYIRAAKNGNVDAQFLLGCCYYEGTIVQCDFKMALKWWNCAAKQDHNNAIGILSFCKNNISICDESWKIKSTRYFSKEELKRIKKAVLVSTSQGVLIKFYLYDGISYGHIINRTNVIVGETIMPEKIECVTFHKLGEADIYKYQI